MGNCASNTQEAEGKARSDMIDRQIEEDSKKYKRECKILLLGACSSSPFVPQREFGEEKKSLSEGMFPTYPISARRVSTTRVAVTGPHIPHLSLALAIIVGALPREHPPPRCGCLHVHTHTLTVTFTHSGLFLLTCSCFHAEHRISVYVLTQTHIVAFR